MTMGRYMHGTEIVSADCITSVYYKCTIVLLLESVIESVCLFDGNLSVLKLVLSVHGTVN